MSANPKTIRMSELLARTPDVDKWGEVVQNRGALVDWTESEITGKLHVCAWGRMCLNAIDLGIITPDVVGAAVIDGVYDDITAEQADVVAAEFGAADSKLRFFLYNGPEFGVLDTALSAALQGNPYYELEMGRALAGDANIVSMNDDVMTGLTIEEIATRVADREQMLAETGGADV